MNLPARLNSLIPPACPRVQSLWIRLIGLIYLVAFASWIPQISPLIGSNGIAPAAETLSFFRSSVGPSAYWKIPTLFWFNTGDTTLLILCLLGCCFAVMLFGGLYVRTTAAACVVVYLSITVIGSPFTDFQWDALLIEAGALTLFLGSRWVVWAYRLLLFRLMFESGVVKLTSHDPTWRNLHALRFHFFTQPLPNPVAYYAAQLPGSVLDALTWLTLALELVVPCFLFLPRRFRLVGAGLIVGLQCFIAMTGNYAFFNLLTIAICVWALDDYDLKQPLRWLKIPGRKTSRAGRITASAALTILMVAGGLQVTGLFSAGVERFTETLLAPTAQFELVNRYGLFAMMTTKRSEIVVEGSMDGTNWREYEFPYKPGDVRRRLRIVAPYQPRLDWQMWFAALGSYRDSPWMSTLLYHLLRDDSVAKQLVRSPFQSPPRSVRALIYDYVFTEPGERAKTGAVWKRTLLGTWYGPVALRARD